MKKIICALALLISLPTFAVSREVIVLIPGAASAGTQIYIKNMSILLGVFGKKNNQYFETIKGELEKIGFNTYYCLKKGDRDRRSLIERSKECNKNLGKLIKFDPNIKFHLLGHSMGGIIARYVYQNKMIKKHIKSITTISTPHYGSMLAHYILRKYKDNDPIGLFLRSIEFTPKKRYILELVKKLYSQNHISLQESKLAFSILNYKKNRYNTPFEVSSKMLENEIKKYYPGRDTESDGIIETSSMSYGKELGTVEADHMESACILYTKESKGCKEVKGLLIKHFQNL